MAAQLTSTRSALARKAAHARGIAGPFSPSTSHPTPVTSESPTKRMFFRGRVAGSSAADAAKQAAAPRETWRTSVDVGSLALAAGGALSAPCAGPLPLAEDLVLCFSRRYWTTPRSGPRGSGSARYCDHRYKPCAVAANVRPAAPPAATRLTRNSCDALCIFMRATSFSTHADAVWEREITLPDRA